MQCLVTGAAGFIGSHLCERLLQEGHQVTGVDGFVPYYPRAIKEANLARARAHAHFRFQCLDLRSEPLENLVADVEWIFHLAAMPGLVMSWTDFDLYWTCNVQATQHLLEAARQHCRRLGRFVYASSSSVHGKFASGDESLPLKPISPYGMTKLAGEHLCQAYADAFDLPLTVLRYYSVYGPRQRPDMAYHRFIRAMLRGEALTVCGDGQQVRSNTYVDDCVAATMAAVQTRAGEVFSVGGGESASVWDVVGLLERLAGRKAEVRREAARPGDQRATFADTSKLERCTGWQPQVSLEEGMARQWHWQQQEMDGNAEK